LNEAGFGFNIDAKLDRQGFQNMLDLRYEIQAGSDIKRKAMDAYIDLSFYENAIKALNQ